MNFAMNSLMKFSYFLGANGVGPSNSTNSEPSGSWLTEVLAWLADFVVNVATVVWGWLISIFYFIIKWCLNLIDILQMFVEKLVGIDVFNQEGGFKAVKSLEETDVIIKFITNETIMDVFGTIMILGAILLIIFCILALIKQNYAAATTDGQDGVKNPSNVLKTAGKAIFMCILIPILLVVGLLGSNAVLASICNSIKGDNDLTIGGLIFTASAYEANKFREYASDGLRVPITHDQGTEVVRPNDYNTMTDMQVLFYKLAKGDVYISYFSDNAEFQEDQAKYFKEWTNKLSVEDVSIDVDNLSGSPVFNQFKTHFNWFMTSLEYGCGGCTLSELNAWNPIINSIYDSNWARNKQLLDVTYDFSSTYTTQKVATISGVDTSVIVNSNTYTQFEDFAPIELEYYVMADLIDYAVEQNEVFYYVNADNPSIQWSDIKWNEDDEALHIDEYNAGYFVAEQPTGSGKVYHVFEHAVPESDQSQEDADKLALQTHQLGDATIVADSVFYVEYYNGINRLYWSNNNVTSESDGATYIICLKNSEGDFIPVTQTTTSFRSSFLADEYTGPVVARGIFKTENIFPKDYCLPTEITEQKTDDYGNELTFVDQVSPISISDQYDVQASQKVTVSSVMHSFCGQLEQFGFIGASLVNGLVYANEALTNLIKDSIKGGFIEDLEKTEGTNLLVNPNINGFSYDNDSDPTTITFYDYNSRKISNGSVENTSFDIVYGEGKTKLNQTSLVLLQKTTFGTVVIPYYYTDATSLEQLIGIITGSEFTNAENTFMLAEYTYDNVVFKTHDGTEHRMLLDFNITRIAQIRGDVEYSASSGEFIVADEYPAVGFNVAVERLENLVVSGGEIYYSDGSLFYGKEDARALYYDFMSNYMGTWTENLWSSFGLMYADGAFSSYMNTFKFQEAHDVFDSQNGKSLSAYDESQGLDPTGADSWTMRRAAVAGNLDELNALRYEFVQQYTLSGFVSADMRAGLSALVEKYDKTYYSVEKNGEGGTLTYYDKNNQKLSSVEFAKTETISSENPDVITLGVAVVCGVGANANNPLFSTVVSINGDSTVSHSAWLNAIKDSTTENAYFDELKAKMVESGFSETGISLPLADGRSKYYYKVDYKLTYTKLLDADNNVVGIVNAKLSSPIVTNISGSHNGYVDAKNSGVYLNHFGEYILTANGVKNYIASDVETSDPNINRVIPLYQTMGNTGYESLGDAVKDHMTAETLTMKSQSEYNNSYIYFLRGDFNWTMIFDFCIHLPTISWDPFGIKFVFRCKLGTSYNYMEDVIYRLQGGMFYLDYNFRTTSGIGISNLYRMSSINPFVLIFSTVLVLGIIWNTVWGLIRRIYDIVLLFIMLPAVCSTMPIDDGGRFKKWKDEIIDKIFQAYSVLIMLNIYFVLVPMLRDVTSNLITITDLPSTITGIFGSVGAGMTSLVGAVPVVGNKFLSVMPMLLEASQLSLAEQALLGHVNSIIYIMFFLVLTTMLKNGKKTIETILGIASLEDGVYKESIDNTFGETKKMVDKVKKSPVGKATGLALKGAGNLVKGGMKLGKKAFDHLRSPATETSEAEPRSEAAEPVAPIDEGTHVTGAPLTGTPPVGSDTAEPAETDGRIPPEGQNVIINTSDGPIEATILSPVDETGVVPVDSDIHTDDVPSIGSTPNALPSGEDYVPPDEELTDFVQHLTNEELNNNINKIKANPELDTSEGLKKGLKFMEDELANRTATENAQAGDSSSAENTAGADNKAEEQPDGVDKKPEEPSKAKGANDDLSDDQLIDKITHSNTVTYTNDKKFNEDHKGFTADQYKEEADRVKGLKEKAMENYDKRDAELGQIEQDKRKALEEATAKRNNAEERINKYKEQNQEVPKELNDDFETAKTNQSNASDALSKTIQERKENKTDKEKAANRINQYAKKLDNFAEGRERDKTSGQTSQPSTGVTLTQGQQQAVKSAVRGAGTVQVNQGRLSDEEIAKQGWSGDERSKELPKTPAGARTQDSGGGARLDKLEKEVADLKQQIKGGKSETKATSTSSSESQEKPKRTFKDKLKTVGKVVGLGAVTLAAPGVGGALIAGTLAVKGGKKVVDKSKSKLSKTAEKWNNKSKGAKIATAATVGSIGFVAAPVATLAAVGGVMAAKGVKKGIDTTKSHLSKHPKAKAFAKYAGLTLVNPVLAAGVFAHDKIKGRGKNKDSSTSSGKTPPSPSSKPSKTLSPEQQREMGKLAKDVERKQKAEAKAQASEQKEETKKEIKKAISKQKLSTSTTAGKSSASVALTTPTQERSKKQYVAPTATYQANKNKGSVKTETNSTTTKKSPTKPRAIDIISEPEPTSDGQTMVKNAAEGLKKQHEKNEANNPIKKSKK